LLILTSLPPWSWNHLPNLRYNSSFVREKNENAVKMAGKFEIIQNSFLQNKCGWCVDSRENEKMKQHCCEQETSNLLTDKISDQTFNCHVKTVLSVYIEWPSQEVKFACEYFRSRIAFWAKGQICGTKIMIYLVIEIIIITVIIIGIIIVQSHFVTTFNASWNHLFLILSRDYVFFVLNYFHFHINETFYRHHSFMDFFLLLENWMIFTKFKKKHWSSTDQRHSCKTIIKVP